MDKLKKQAIKLGLCKEWQENWEETSLIDKYINGITWCMKREFPSLEDMKKYDEELVKRGVYNSKNASIFCDRSMYVFNNSKIDFYISGYDVCRIYVGRNSVINAFVSDNAILYVDNYGSTINKEITGSARCIEWNGKEHTLNK